MDDNSYNRDACLEYFKAYKECKKQMVRNNICKVVTVKCILSTLFIVAWLHHFLSISLDEQYNRSYACKNCTLIVCTKLAWCTE